VGARYLGVEAISAAERNPMTLTIGSAPFGSAPGGVFNFEYRPPGNVIYFEDSPRRVRVEIAGHLIADSRRVKLLHESGHLPVYYFPREDVDVECLVASDTSYRCPFKGDAELFSVRIGDRVAEDAAWGYPEPIPGAPPIGGHLAFDWGSMDRWLEEDEEIEGHPRDPYTRIDVREASRHVIVSLAGTPLAETRRPKLLFETSLPPRIYIARADVRTDLLVRSRTTTYCPYKGRATWWSVRVGDELVADVGWSYPEPFPEASTARDHISFLNERLTVVVDGEPLEHLPHRR
jgi:uncharacterized protein (DUF427 family)